jgi:hypothetical protein
VSKHAQVSVTIEADPKQTMMTATEYYKTRELSKRRRLDADVVGALLRLFMQDHGLLPDWCGGIVEAREFFGGVPEASEICTSAGGCFYERKYIYISVLAVQTYSPAQIKDVILHEIAHALVPQPIAGTAAHGEAWQIKAVEIGVREWNILDCLADDHDALALAVSRIRRSASILPR